MAKKTEAIAVRLPPALRADLVALAEKLDRPVSWVIRRALEAYLAGEKEKERE